MAEKIHLHGMLKDVAWTSETTFFKVLFTSTEFSFKFHLHQQCSEIANRFMIKRECQILKTPQGNIFFAHNRNVFSGKIIILVESTVSV